MTQFNSRALSIFSIIVIYIAISYNRDNARYILFIVTIPAASFISLLILNSLVLYVYIRYFIPSKSSSTTASTHKTTAQFKPLRFTHKSIWPKLQQQIEGTSGTDNSDSFQQLTQDNEINLAIKQLLMYIMRDFINSWYNKITPPSATSANNTGIASNERGTGFPASVEALIRSAIADIILRMEQTDFLLVILNKVIPKITVHMYEFRMAERSLRTNNVGGAGYNSSSTGSSSTHHQSMAASVKTKKLLATTSPDYMIDDLLLASRFRSGQLHNALTSVAVITTKPTEIAYLRRLVERLLPLLFSKKKEEAECEPVRTVIREILANSVLQPVMSMLADPDFWNQIIDAYLGKAIIEQKMVKQLREVLDRHSTQQHFDYDDEMMDELTRINKNEGELKGSMHSTDSDNGNAKLHKTRSFGPKNQLSSAFLGTGISTDFRPDSNSSDSDDSELQTSRKSSAQSSNSNKGTGAETSASLFYFFKSAFDPLSLSSTSTTASSKKTKSSIYRQQEQQYGFSGIPFGKQRSFPDFMDMIKEEKSLIDLKRVRNDIVTQIRKRKAQIADRDPEEIIDGERVNDILTYLSRLGAAKKRVDKRIALLSGEYSNVKASTSHLFSMGSRKPSFSNTYPTSVRYSLKDILTNTTSLSYFMEFMDRRGEIIKLQFWLIVEGFNSTDLSIRCQQRQFLQDVKMVYDTYFANLAPHRLHIVEQLHSDLEKAIEAAEKSNGDEDTAQLFTNDILELRLRLLRIQQHIFWELEKEHYPYFKRSDLYFKFLSSAPTNMTSITAIDNVNSQSNNTADTRPPFRRSLDETTLYTNQTEVSNTKQQRPASLHESSALTVDSTSSSIKDLKSDTAVKRFSYEESRTSTTTDNDSLPQPQRSQSDNIRLRNQSQQHTLFEDSSPLSPSKQKTAPTSKLNYFSNIFSSASNYRRPRAKSSTSSSFASFLFDPSTTEQQPADKQSHKDASTEIDEDLSQQEMHQPQLQKTVSKRASLVRSNTVDAVEAELRSILDGNSVHNVTTNDEKDDIQHSAASKESVQVSNLPRRRAQSVTTPLDIAQLTSTKRPSSSSSAFSLCGPQASIKTTTALPVQSLAPLPTWTSNGSTSAIAELEHDSLDEISSIKSNKSSISATRVDANVSIPSTADVAITGAYVNNDTDRTLGERNNNNIHFAPPGDLLLTAKIKQLNEEIEKLTAQEAIVDALIVKAEEHQNKIEELRILKKSKSMFRQEIQQMEYQKSQYQLQESENVLLPQRTQVHITSATIGTDKNGEFALYIIEVQQLSSSASTAASSLKEEDRYASGGWIVARRYSEFLSLHQKLKEKFPAVKFFDFPSKQWPLFMKLQKSFVEARRVSLERYLRALMTNRDICSSQEFRAFLSQQNVYVPGPTNATFPSSENSLQPWNSTSVSSTSSLKSPSKSSNQPSSSPSIQHLQKSVLADSSNQHPSNGFMRQIYKTVAAGIDDIFIAPSMLDLITQRLGEQVVMEFSSEPNGNKQQPLSPVSTSSSTSSLRSHKNLYSSTNMPDSNAASSTVEPSTALAKTEGITHFTEPLCDLFIELFELKDKTNWLRRQAIVIIIQQILEGTIERKLKETMKHLSSTSMIASYVNKVLDSLWPNGGSMSHKEPRTWEEKAQTRDEANRKLSTWLPDLLGNMVGRQNARKGARRLFSVLQNQRLNQDLVYNLLDEIVLALFPELQAETVVNIK